MLHLAVLMMAAVTTTGGDSGSAVVCPPTPSVCGFVAGATRFDGHQGLPAMVVVVHDDVDAAERFVAGATGIESR